MRRLAAQEPPARAAAIIHYEVVLGTRDLRLRLRDLLARQMAGTGTSWNDASDAALQESITLAFIHAQDQGMESIVQALRVVRAGRVILLGLPAVETGLPVIRWGDDFSAVLSRALRVPHAVRARAPATELLPTSRRLPRQNLLILAADEGDARRCARYARQADPAPRFARHEDAVRALSEREYQFVTIHLKSIAEAVKVRGPLREFLALDPLLGMQATGRVDCAVEDPETAAAVRNWAPTSRLPVVLLPAMPSGTAWQQRPDGAR